MHRVEDLNVENSRQAEYWGRFEKKAGVYCFFDEEADDVKYIGMSHTDTGNRLVGWLFNENKVKENLYPKDVVLSVVLKEEPYMASALEMYLIKEIKPSLNVTGNKE